MYVSAIKAKPATPTLVLISEASEHFKTTLDTRIERCVQYIHWCVGGAWPASSDIYQPTSFRLGLHTRIIYAIKNVCEHCVHGNNVVSRPGRQNYSLRKLDLKISRKLCFVLL